MRRHLLLITLLCGAAFAPALSAPGPGLPPAPDADARRAFFDNLRRMCGRQYEGETRFPPDADHPLAGKKLLLTIGPCSEGEVRIPFHADEDKSRTWVFTRTEKGLLFKHDHRHPDGTPDRVTMYGGWAAPGGTPREQRFPADDETAKLIPEAATNVWTLRLSPDGGELTYRLERHSKPRYEATFKLRPAAP